MKTSTRNILLIIGVLVVLILLARYVVFKKQFEAMGAGLERVSEWQENYARENPDASQEEIDAAFEASIANLKLWQAQYKKDHPNATKQEMDAAFNTQFSGGDFE